MSPNAGRYAPDDHEGLRRHRMYRERIGERIGERSAQAEQSEAER